MRAAYIERTGGPEVLKVGELPEPAAAPGEIVVDVYAASINGADWKVRAGAYAPLETFPYVLGRDFSGTVAALGDGVDEFAVGDPVFGVCDVGQEGAYAEKLAIKASLVSAKPDDVSHADMAALALTGLTALVSIEDTLRLRPGEKILIQGGAGGVAGFAIQLAKHIGAHVVTTASPRNIDYVKGLGADQVIDYTKDDFTNKVADCDAVFETVGGEVAGRSFEVLKPGGRAAFIASGWKAPPAPRPDVESLRPKVGRDRPHLERIKALLKAGAVRPLETTIYPLRDVVEAHRVSEGRHLRGKLVLRIR